jgi:hypothetical protein
MLHGLYVSFGDYLKLFSLFLVEMRIFSWFEQFLYPRGVLPDISYINSARIV